MNQQLQERLAPNLGALGRWAAVAVALAAGSSLVSPAAARVWLILPDGSGDAPTIQAGVDSAAVGDTVLVAAGTYDDLHMDAFAEYSVVEMQSGVVLRSQSGPEDTIIDAASSQPSRGILCVACDGSTVIDGFTITGGDTYFGAGIYISSGAPVIENNAFLDAYGGTGGALMITNAAAPRVTANLFLDNVACCGPGGAILVDAGAQPELIENVFRGSEGFQGGAVAVQNAGATIVGNSFEDNSGTSGGALMLWSAAGEVRGNTFEGNQASSSGGAVTFRTSNNVSFEQNILVGNSASGGGGAILLDDSSPEILLSTLAHNVALDGGGIKMTGPAAPLISQTLIAWNEGQGQVHCQTISAPVFTCCDVFGEVQPFYDGGCEDPTGQNGNIALDPLFCGPQSVELQECSPCVDGLGCGQMGALGAGCDCELPTATRRMTWGKVKQRHR
ncbi:MAG: hypothetical protein GF355_03650 [Candidatus Eisenbacteria bacterium]|nr:hypothetical protein [Candidatus Eisenbacteria bacterium]